MLDKLRDKIDEFDIYELNNYTLIISFLLFIIGIIFVKNVYVIILIYLLMLYLSRLFEKNIIKFICSLLPIIILGYFLIHFIHFTFIKDETFNTFRFIIKILLSVNYIAILYYYFKNKKIKLVNLLKKKNKKYSFKELRRKNIEKYRENTNNYIDNYLESHNINLESDYFKVIEDNIDNKVSDELEEYVWMNYLRFYKNQKYKKNNIFNVYNLSFLIIHVILLIIVLIVR